MSTILVSACLLGENCKYNGKNNLKSEILALKEHHTIISVCPEVLGGLPTPRKPVEICNGKAINCDGEDVDIAFKINGCKESFRNRTEEQD